MAKRTMGLKPLRLLFYFLVTGIVAFALLKPQTTFAYDPLGRKDSYLGVQRFQLFSGFGFSSLINDSGVTSDGLDISYRIGLGYSFTRRLRIEFLYQIGWLPILSPDPLSSGDFRSKLLFNSEIWRLVYRYDRGSIVPYLTFGIGLYQLNSVNPQTGLDFGTSTQMPVGGGIETFVYKNHLSLTLEYTYHVLFSEQQNAGVLTLLGVDEVSFNAQSITMQLYWHLF